MSGAKKSKTLTDYFAGTAKRRKGDGGDAVEKNYNVVESVASDLDEIEIENPDIVGNEDSDLEQ